MLKNILASPKISCVKCNSDNTEIHGQTGILGAMSSFVRLTPLQGQVRVICRDCGHEALLMVQ